MSRDIPGIQTKTHPGPAPGDLGQGLFASSDIQIGEDVLYILNPFVAVLDTHRMADTCSGCFGKKQLETGNQTALKACTGCQAVKYCDKACQSRDWKFAHSFECPIFSKLYPRILPINARAVLRMVLRSRRKKYTSQELDLFLQLETHIQEIREENASQWERIALSSKAVKAYSETDVSEETISTFGAKLDLNAFNLTNALSDRVGLYLHPYAALINHSCDYNSIVGFDGPELFIKALRPIRKGEQIFISYVDVTNPPALRQQELRERYYFTCQCSKCKRDTVTPQMPLAALSSELETLHRKAYALLESISTATTSGPDPNNDESNSSSSNLPAKTISQLESTMQDLKSSSWPITSQPFVSLRDELIASLLAAGRFKAAFVHTVFRYLRVDPEVYVSEEHPLRHVHMWALAKLALHLSQEMEGSGNESSKDLVALDQSGLNFGLIAWSVLKRLLEKSEKGCTVPGFKRLVKATFGEVHQEFLSHGFTMLQLRGAEVDEWEKIEKLLGAVKPV